MSFSEKLRENQMKHAHTALLQTVFQDPSQTIGDIWDALEADGDGEVMWEMFKGLTIGKIVTAGIHFAEGQQAKNRTEGEPGPSASKPRGRKKPVEEEEENVEFDESEDDDLDEDEGGEDEGGDEFEDEDEDEEGGGGEDEDEDEDEDESPKTAKSRKRKKASSGKVAKPRKKKKDEPKALDLSTVEAQKAYSHSIIKCLKSNAARDEEDAMKSTQIRDEVGGDPKQFRDAINGLIEAERVNFAGKARGMKYWLS